MNEVRQYATVVIEPGDQFEVDLPQRRNDRTVQIKVNNEAVLLIHCDALRGFIDELQEAEQKMKATAATVA